MMVGNVHVRNPARQFRTARYANSPIYVCYSLGAIFCQILTILQYGALNILHPFAVFNMNSEINTKIEIRGAQRYQ